MSTVDYIKSEINRLYKTNPNIHININMSRPKLTVAATPAVIKGVYPNIFRIEENVSGHPRCHSIQYTEVLIGQVGIPELGRITK